METLDRKKIVAVTIPVYKDDLNRYEEASFRRCLKVLSKNDICLVTNRTVCLNGYKRISDEYAVTIKVEYFDAHYFEGIKGYNSLMLNLDFYKRFRDYNYILIYQLDAYVFRDELTYWCNQGYDYIGAPWFYGYATHEEGADLWAVGNGGFSLRKIEYFIKALSWKLPVQRYSFNRLFSLKLLLKACGYRNNMRYLLKNCTMNEDAFFAQSLKNSWIPPTLPDVKTAISFAFEKSPTYLMNLNHHRLPFGCHAFRRYEFEGFWQKHIKDFL